MSPSWGTVGRGSLRYIFIWHCCLSYHITFFWELLQHLVFVCLFVFAVQCELTTKRNNSCNFSCAISNLPPNIWGWKDERKNSNWAENQEKHLLEYTTDTFWNPDVFFQSMKLGTSILKSSNFRRWTVSEDNEDFGILRQLWLIITHAFIVKSLLNSLK